jgi:ATP-binding cassette subfamily B protein
MNKMGTSQSGSRDFAALGHKLQSLLQRGLRRRITPLQQMNEVECGATCLAMILHYYGRMTSITEIHEHYGSGRNGITAFNLLQAASDYGLRARAISHTSNDLRTVQLPAIVHWEFNHFVIVEDWSHHGVTIIDPATGRERLSLIQFSERFTGIIILLEPGAQFLRHTDYPRLSLRTYAAQYIRQSPWLLAQIVGATLLLQAFGLAVPLLTKIIVDQIVPQNMINIMQLLGIGLVLLLLSQGVVMFLREMLLLYLQIRIDTQTMPAFFEHLLNLPLRFFQHRARGDILTRLASNMEIRDIISSRLVATLLDAAMVSLTLSILLTQSLLFGLCVLGIGLVQTLVLIVTAPLIRRQAQQELTSISNCQSYETEVLTGIATIKAAGAEPHALEHWLNLFFRQLHLSSRQHYVLTTINIMMSTLRTLLTLGILWFGTLQVLSGQLPIGTMLALSSLAAICLNPLVSLIQSGLDIQFVRTHLERIADVVEAAPEQDTSRTIPPPQLTGQISLQEVSFQYDTQGTKIIDAVSLTIAPGQKVAIVGRTGSGKSTLGKLLLGLYVPTTGNICYDAIPLRYLNYRSLRTQCGAVLQESTIFSGSIRQNIAFNNPQLPPEEIVKAAQIAALHDDILQMPMSYETPVAEDGAALSGGQRQRLAIARALAHQPAILLLDEATSALDVITERQVEQNLAGLSCTQIIIAHRLSTIQSADLILVMDHGRLVESGTHGELLRQQGHYASLIQHQLAPEERLSSV